MLVEKSVLLAYSAEQMFDLVENVEQYPVFLPWCAGARVTLREPLQDNEETLNATVYIDYHGLKQSFTTANTQKRAHYIRMHLVDGPFSALNGEWRFIALDDQACKVEFRLNYEFSSRILSSVIAPVFKRIADSFVEGFVRRAEQVYG